jgi:hypothetical protein
MQCRIRMGKDFSLSNWGLAKRYGAGDVPIPCGGRYSFTRNGRAAHRARWLRRPHGRHNQC